MLGRILVVDDEPMNRDMLSRRLTKRDYEAVTAASAYEALAILEDQDIDLVILDIMMPGMSGLEMLAVVRQSASSSQIPIIMATAKADSEDVVEALNRGANDYVLKPLDMPVVFARIERAIRERKTTVALERMNRDLLSNQNRSSLGDTTTHVSVDQTSQSKDRVEQKLGSRSSGLAPVQTISKYEIRKTLGTGGSGKVYLAYDPLIEREVAIKVLSKKFSDNNVWTQRFLLEAQATGQIDHPNIISVYDVNMHEGSLYIVMEYAENGNLKTRTVQQGPPGLNESCRCVIEAARGLHAAHENNLVHRDVKPDNLLLTVLDQVKVSDFGIVKFQTGDTRDLELTGEGKRIGTPMYMSPEQIRLQEVDARTDIYALGATFYFLLTGTPPYGGMTIDDVTASHLKDPRPDPLRVNPELPAACTQIIAKSMAVDPDQRYQTMLSFLTAIESMQGSSTSS
ncbi:MAG: protein kinase [Pirellulaceae bacterium]|nr:protein kinase [Pirellulaceae bacterium]